MLDCENCKKDSELTSLYDVIACKEVNLNNFKINKGDNLAIILTKLDKVLTDLKNKNIEVLFDDLQTNGCLQKSIVLNELNNRQNIVLSVDNDCVIENSECGCNKFETAFIITSNRYEICGLQTATLQSNCSGTVWYNSDNIQIQTGNTLIVSNAGTYYAKCNNQTSNFITIIKQAVCSNYPYIKRKLFYKDCGENYFSLATEYSKEYISTISYADAQYQALLDSSNFDAEGQAIANNTSECIYKPVVPTTINTFNVYLSNAQC